MFSTTISGVVYGICSHLIQVEVDAPGTLSDDRFGCTFGETFRAVSEKSSIDVRIQQRI